MIRTSLTQGHFCLSLRRLTSFSLQSVIFTEARLLRFALSTIPNVQQGHLSAPDEFNEAPGARGTNLAVERF